MACDVYGEVDVKATRKPHRCAYCNKLIPAGSSATKEHGIYEREPFTRYYCNECKPYVSEFWEWTDNECGNIAEAFGWFMVETGRWEDDG